ncbi:MAG: hypothetical protein P4L51_20120 [Puia sp.]|nr:hypothetical protein [Puia sp.]
MQLTDFIMLDAAEKKLILLHAGVLIARRKEMNRTVFLYHFGSYYVETYRNLENKSIEEYVVFDNTKWLTPYLESIPIDSLLE